MTLSFKVPIKNLFYMLSYAKTMPDLRESMLRVEDDLINYDFLVKLYLKEVAFILHRSMTREYVAEVSETATPSGRILFNESIPHMMWRRPSLVCEKDEYTENILLNQVIKTSLINIYQNENISTNLRREGFLLTDKIFSVKTIALTEEIFNSIHFNRHNYYYKKVINLAHLLFTLQLMSHKKGGWTLDRAELSDQELSKIFEEFLYNFYDEESSLYRTKNKGLTWNLKGDDQYLPGMLTDVPLVHRREKKTIIIDAKFYEDIFQWNYGKASFRSNHLYQMFAYINHQAEDHFVRGILIYPYNGQRVKEQFLYKDNRTIEVQTLDLSASWGEIKENLLSIVEE